MMSDVLKAYIAITEISIASENRMKERTVRFQELAKKAKRGEALTADDRMFMNSSPEANDFGRVQSELKRLLPKAKKLLREKK